MKKINSITGQESILNKIANLSKEEVDKLHIRENESYSRFYFSAKKSYRSNNKCIDFNEYISAKDVHAVLEYCKQWGLGYFSISDSSTELMSILVECASYGCEYLGIAKQNTEYTDLDGNRETKNAIFFKI